MSPGLTLVQETQQHHTAQTLTHNRGDLEEIGVGGRPGQINSSVVSRGGVGATRRAAAEREAHRARPPRNNYEVSTRCECELALRRNQISATPNFASFMARPLLCLS